MTVKDYPPITTKEYFATASKMLMMGLATWAALGEFVSDQAEEYKAELLGVRKALQAAPFVMKKGEGPVDATPETKAIENGFMDESFRVAGIEIPAAEPIAEPAAV